MMRTIILTKLKFLGLGINKVLFLIVCIFNYSFIFTKTIKLSNQEIKNIADKIFKNECGCSTEKLTWWRDGEDFASLGIGHFIWYPKNGEQIYKETFPGLIKFIEAEGKKVPEFLKLYCPWNTREEFFKDIDSKKMKELRKLLLNTFDLQTKFIIQRVQTSWPHIVNKAEPKKRNHIKKQFNRISSAPGGMYAIIDYINFKGEGFKSDEKYNNKGWGLLQVLENMQGTENGKKAMEDFVKSAEETLEIRVKNSPAQKQEDRWLQGWKNRVRTYLN